MAGSASWVRNFNGIAKNCIMNTSVLRLKTSLQDSVLDLLNEQIAMEAHSEASYLSMSAWCYAQGLVGCGEFFKKQSGEEREHMMKLFKLRCRCRRSCRIPRCYKDRA